MVINRQLKLFQQLIENSAIYFNIVILEAVHPSKKLIADDEVGKYPECPKFSHNRS